MIGQVGQWTWTPSATPLKPKKWNACFWIMFNFWWSAGLVNGFKPHPPPISSHKNEMLIFVLHSTSDDWPGWSLDSNPIHLLSQAKKKWNAHFWITFNFWWSAGLVDELESHLPPLSSQKNEMVIFGLLSISGDHPGWSMDSNAIHHPSPAKEWNANFWITFNFWWSAGLVDELESHLPPLSSQKNEMLIFGLLSISGDHPGWSMDSNAIHHPSPAKEWNANFWITFNFWWSVGLVNGLESHLLPLSKQKNDMLIYVLRSTSDDWPGWSMDSNPICNLSATKNMKCLFLDYVELLMISQAGRRIQTPSATSFQPKKWNAHFCIMFNFW